MTEIDEVFEGVRARRDFAFQNWITMVEMPLHLSLRRFARAVDVECVVQQTFVDAWKLLRQKGYEWPSENVSLQWVISVAWDVARSEARRNGFEHLLPPHEVSEAEPGPDEKARIALREAMKDCTPKLTAEEEVTLLCRLQHGGFSEASIAGCCRKDVTTLASIVTKARRKVIRCLERKGIEVDLGRRADEPPLTDEQLEALPESAVYAFREVDAECRPVPPPAWFELSPEERERLYRLQIITRRMESVLFNVTEMCVVFLIARFQHSLAKAEGADAGG